MRHEKSAHQPWARKDGNPLRDPQYVFTELQRRELRDLTTCRQVWEHEGDPLAVCEAVRQTALPDWLRDTLLVLMTDGEAGYPPLRQRMWRARTRHAIDAERVAQTTMVRTHPERPQTWEMSYRMGDRLSRDRYDDMPIITVAGLKRAFERVCRGLNRPCRYYRPRPGLSASIADAWTFMLGLMEQSAGRK